ncbi:MAG TPA: hypothetical protein VNS99_05510, partial [Gaiellales bacterium]|nr:hypothetical protein [Gaiellales bacterium]
TEALSHELGRKPLDRALLTVFAEQVREVGRGESRVWDVGCGPGPRHRVPDRAGPARGGHRRVR